MAGKKPSRSSSDVQHRLAQDISGTTPPDHLGRLPLTPPATAERSRIETPDTSPPSALVRLLETIDASKKTDDPASWIEFSIEPSFYKSHRKILERSLRRFDYDPNRSLLSVRMPSTVHECLLHMLVHDLQRRLDELAKQDDDAGRFASKIRCLGSATVELCEGDGEAFQKIERSPDVQFRHQDSLYPGVVIEIAYSQDGKKLRKLAQDYILYSNGDTKAVIGINISCKGKESTISLWRPKFTRADDNVLELESRQVISHEPFRSANGRACNARKHLTLCLGDFATDALAAEHESVPVAISYNRLFEMLQDADKTVATRARYTAHREANSTKVIARKRRMSSSSAEQLLLDDEKKFAKLEEVAMERAEQDDGEFKARRSKRRG